MWNFLFNEDQLIFISVWLCIKQDPTKPTQWPHPWVLDWRKYREVMEAQSHKTFPNIHVQPKRQQRSDESTTLTLSGLHLRTLGGLCIQVHTSRFPLCFFHLQTYPSDQRRVSFPDKRAPAGQPNSPFQLLILNNSHVGFALVAFVCLC